MWIKFRDDCFNLNSFCHIWIENHCEGPNNKIVGFYLMGEFSHNGEEVVISEDWETLQEARDWLLELTRMNA